jgi:hypothetical protein
VRCERVRDLVPGLVDGSSVANRFTRAHVNRCLRCQAELAHYRRLRRTARSLEQECWVPPADLLDVVLARLERAGDHTAARTRRAFVYAGGMAATAAGAAGAVLLTRRARSHA